METLYEDMKAEIADIKGLLAMSSAQAPPCSASFSQHIPGPRNKPTYEQMETLYEDMKTEIADVKGKFGQALTDFQLLVQERSSMQILINANNAIIQQQKETIAELQHFKEKYEQIERVMHGTYK